VRVVDSSGWLEWLTDGALAEHYAPFLADPSEVLTPVIVMHEVYRWMRRERGEQAALVAAAALQRTVVVPLTPVLALEAADLGLEHRLAMADSLVYATAVHHRAELITSDADFEKLPGVVYLAKRR
jgi:predicted nucleic acid-binding protein